MSESKLEYIVSRSTSSPGGGIKQIPRPLFGCKLILVNAAGKSRRPRKYFSTKIMFNRLFKAITHTSLLIIDKAEGKGNNFAAEIFIVALLTMPIR